MRVKAHDGTWVPVEGEPRLMRRADAIKGEKGIYKLYTEGIDDDGDGQYNEDTPGGTNVNINFPHLFKSFGKRSGLYPGSTPESEALLKFAFAHPELAMVLSFGTTNYLLAPPQGGRKGSMDTENIRIPVEIGTAMGIDVSRTYTMDEIIEFVQPMMPPGMTADESMIASFLGLGAVVNPMQEDLAFYNEISSDYKEYLKKKGLTEERFDPAQPEEGSFEMWAYYHSGPSRLHNGPLGTAQTKGGEEGGQWHYPRGPGENVVRRISCAGRGEDSCFSEGEWRSAAVQRKNGYGDRKRRTDETGTDGSHDEADACPEEG